MSNRSKTVIVAAGVAGILAAWGTLTCIRARSTSSRDACIQNLRMIEAAKQQWELEKAQTTSSVARITNR